MENDKIVEHVLKWFEEAPEKDKDIFKNSTKDELIRYHHYLGKNIRNEFDLWEISWKPEIVDGIDISENHPDAISMRIIEEVWRRINKEK